MPVRPVIQLGDPRLRQQCVSVGAFDRDILPGLIEDMRDTLRDFQKTHGAGRGIAAPQIGVAKRVVYLEYGDVGMALCNPVIEQASPEMMDVWDSCFSYWGIAFRVRRHQRVVVSYARPDGTAGVVEAGADLSELLQHEIEHLDGVLAIDQLVRPGEMVSWEQYCASRRR